MSVLLIFLIILAILAAILLIVALFVKKSYSIEREIIIYQPKQDVFNYIKYLRNQNNFSKWATMDPKMKQEYIGTDGTIGFVSAWDSDKKDVGKGEQTIRKIIEGERVEFDLHFIKPFEGRAVAHMVTEPISEKQTRVEWGFVSSMKYPMNIMLLFMNMEKLIGSDLATGLSNLKNVLEK